MKTYLDRIASVLNKLDTTFPSKSFDTDSQHVALGPSTRAANLFNSIKVNLLATNLNMELTKHNIDADIDFSFPGVVCDGVVPVTMNIYGINASEAHQYIMEEHSSDLKQLILETLTRDAKKNAGIKTIELTIVKISAERVIL